MTKRKYINPPRSEDCVWRDGPPPEIGWWPADWLNPPRPNCLRWWDGKSWTLMEMDYMDAQWVAQHAGNTFHAAADIRWTDRWWEEGK